MRAFTLAEALVSLLIISILSGGIYTYISQISRGTKKLSDLEKKLPLLKSIHQGLYSNEVFNKQYNPEQIKEWIKTNHLNTEEMISKAINIKLDQKRIYFYHAESEHPFYQLHLPPQRLSNENQETNEDFP